MNHEAFIVVVGALIFGYLTFWLQDEKDIRKMQLFFAVVTLLALSPLIAGFYDLYTVRHK